MLNDQTTAIIDRSRKIGWVLEPDAKTIFSIAGLPVPRFQWARTGPEALNAAGDIGYPVAVKVVSPRIVHKSDAGGVMINIANKDDLDSAFSRFSGMDGFDGVIVEEKLRPGPELIVGASIDFQFGPVILLGIGGTSVEIYKDTAIRLAPLIEKDVRSMIAELKGHPLLTGYRGAPPVNMEELTRILIRFSELVMEMEDVIESIDLNPVICTADRCVIADARIMLTKG
jgi:acetate---CoA ligase (ADP-forming) subunit beta